MTGRAPTDRQRFAWLLVTAAAASVTIVLSAMVARSDDSALVERRAWAMGTTLTVTVRAADRATAVEASESALRAVAAVEERLSTWNPGSELSRLNAAPPGSEVALSTELWSNLREATRWWEATGGAFDPGIASLASAWDLRGEGRVPSEAELAGARASSGWSHVALGPATARFDVAGFGVEEGGFGKGVALREARDAARATGADCVVLDLGGQVEVEGGCGELWVDVADPDHRQRGRARLRMAMGSVATSGNSERGRWVDGVLLGHLLDPRSGRPARDWGSVTVMTSDPVAADCLSTALYVMGPSHGLEWVRARRDVEAVFVERRDEGLQITATAGLEGRLERVEGEVRYLPRSDATH